MSIVKQVILNADEELRYPNLAEIRMIQNFCKTGENRIRLAKILAKNQTKIVDRATQKFWQICPRTPSNSGNARKTEAAQRDVGWYVRLVSYCLLAGNDKPLEEIGIVGMKDLYNNVNVPLANVRQFIICIKAETLALLSSQDAAEVAPYFDLIIQYLAYPGAPYFQNDGVGASLPAYA